MNKVNDFSNELIGGGIGSGWYEETEQDAEERRLENIAALSLKQKLDEIWAIYKLNMERRNAIKEIS